MDEWITRTNIKRFRQLLDQGPDEAKRRMITRLLAEEEAKLQGALAKDQAKTKQA